jgi:hypothetical protein
MRKPRKKRRVMGWALRRQFKSPWLGTGSIVSDALQFTTAAVVVCLLFWRAEDVLSVRGSWSLLRVTSGR